MKPPAWPWYRDAVLYWVIIVGHVCLTVRGLLDYMR